MAQTTDLAPKLKKVYKKYLQNKYFDFFIIFFLNNAVDFYAFNKKFYFPDKFTWEWRMEMLTENYERDTTDLFKKIITPGMVVIDIGAHIGYYTRLFSKLTGDTGRVYAFEADIDNFELLKKNTSHFNNITVNNLALSDHRGPIDFYKINNSTGCHSLIKSKNAKIVTVKGLTLDEFLEKNQIERVDAIKIDIEGGEPIAFRGMQKLFSKSNPLIIVMEFSPASLKNAGQDPYHFLNSLRSYGFQISQILSAGKTKPLDLKNLKAADWYRTGYINILLTK